MALTKRGKTWHTQFFIDGQRFRQSLETTDWREAQSKEKDLIAAAKAGKIGPVRAGIARLTFRDAAKQYLEDRKPRLAALSVRTEQERAKQVNKAFGDVPVHRITVAAVAEYIRKRKAANIANATVNRELDLIRGVLKKAKRWYLFADEIKPLPLHQSIGRALGLDEKARLLKVAASRPEWQNAYYAALLALNTTVRGCELKGLRWRDIDLIDKSITVRRSKTEAGLRVIPLNSDAYAVLLALYSRAKALASGRPEDNGEVKPEHYIFAACESGHVDPARPQGGWRTAWRTLTRAVSCPKCGLLQNPTEGKCAGQECDAVLKDVKSPLAGLRFHDLRHHAITELAESQTSDSTIMSIAGHVSAKMLAHYSHVRIEAKRKALDALSTGRLKMEDFRDGGGGYDTKSDTKSMEATKDGLQVIDYMVELVGLEPTTSSLRTMRSPS